jgi:hypothetical protein
MKTTLLTFIAALFVISSATAGVTKGTYRGTSKTTVNYLNPSTLAVVATESYTCNETVVIAPPKKVGAQVEANPFTFVVAATSPKTPAVNGDVKAASARIFPASGGGSVLLQYWVLQNTATGFVGALGDNYIDLGLARDRVIAKLRGTPTGYKMHSGEIAPGLQCTLASVVTGSQMALTIKGYAFVPGQAIIQFTTKINARR